jgi:hypothetical protein
MKAGRTIAVVSEYEALVELAAKGLAQRDTYPMPESVTTPESFYEVMARAALDAIGLQALLNEMKHVEEELRLAADPPPTTPPPPAAHADVARSLPTQPSVSTAHTLRAPSRVHGRNGPDDLDPKDGCTRGQRKAENVRLRR